MLVVVVCSIEQRAVAMVRVETSEPTTAGMGKMAGLGAALVLKVLGLGAALVLKVLGLGAALVLKVLGLGAALVLKVLGLVAAQVIQVLGPEAALVMSCKHEAMGARRMHEKAPRYAPACLLLTILTQLPLSPRLAPDDALPAQPPAVAPACANVVGGCY
jgi:hypothetical protein